MGALSGVLAVDLGAAAARAAMADAAVEPTSVDLVVMGHARQAGNGPNPARQVLKKAGIPDTTPAYTLNMACASGLQAIWHTAQSVAMGEAEVVVAGGMESMSRVPFLLDRFRTGYRLGHGEVVDGMYRDGFFCPLCGELMGETAERLAEEYQISREEQDAYAAESQQRCERARKAGLFQDEIAPVDAPDGKGGKVRVTDDEHPRDGVTVAGLAKLPPVFKKDGTVHAGNSSGITDGGAAVVVMSERAAKERGLKPLARVAAGVSVGLDPARMGLGPVPAVRKLEQKTGVRLDAYDRIELNEAFSAQVLACRRELKFDMARTNVVGGAIALGHPIGCTGARIVVTLLHEMRRSGAARGLATLCVSGGLGMAVAFERGPGAE